MAPRPLASASSKPRVVSTLILLLTSTLIIGFCRHKSPKLTLISFLSGNWAGIAVPTAVPEKVMLQRGFNTEASLRQTWFNPILRAMPERKSVLQDVHLCFWEAFSHTLAMTQGRGSCKHSHLCWMSQSFAVLKGAYTCMMQQLRLKEQGTRPSQCLLRGMRLVGLLSSQGGVLGTADAGHCRGLGAS